jgi:serine protease AprX
LNVFFIQLPSLAVQNGQGTDASVIAAIYQAIAVKNTYNIRVMNLSLGRPVFESYKVDPLCQAVEAAWKAGIVVVVAAGNDGRDPYTNGYATITAPGNDPYVITVGAMNTKATPDRGDDVMTTYSSKGPTAIDHIAKPDLVAPGNRVISVLGGNTLVHAYPQNIPSKDAYGKEISQNYFSLSGTSMAAPVVSGAVALLLEQNPRLTPDQVKARLMKSAYKNLPQYTTIIDSGRTFFIQYDAFTVGAGYLDIQAALSSTDLATLSAKSPTVTYDPVTKNVYFVSDSSAIWGSSAMWGSAVWGANVFVGSKSAMWGSSALWGSSAMWGSNTTQGFSAMWGSSSLWGSSAMWGSTTPRAMDIMINGDN